MKYEIGVRRLGLRHTFTISRNSSDEKFNVFVKLEKDGITAWGEAAPNVRYQESPESSIKALETLCEQLPENWMPYHHILEQMKEGIEGEYSAKAALDMALMDWVGQKIGQPLFGLWGLDPLWMPETSMTIAIAPPAEMAQRAAEFSAFNVLKIKLGTENDREMIKAIRKASNVVLRVDANEGWKDRERAIREIEWLNEQNVELIEQPMPAGQVEDMIWLKQRSPLPLIADEAFTTVDSLFELDAAYHGVNIKLMKCGGTHQARKAIAIGRSLGLSIMLGCMVESSVGIAAAAHLAPLVDFADLDGNLLINNDPFRGHGVESGKVMLNRNPGLGVTEIV